MAISNISLTSSMRSNLLSLQSTQKLMDTTQNRLSTGKKVNSALDNPSNFFSAQSLTARANDLSALMDSIGQAISTLETADKGITSLTKYVEQAKSLANSARDTSNVQSSKTSSVMFDPKNVKTQKITDAVGGINDGDSFTIRLGSATNMTGSVNLNETQTLNDLGLAAGKSLEVIVDGETYTFTTAAAGTAASYDATTKTSTLGIDTTVKDFMADIVENIGRKKVSAELVDGRMQIKTLDNTSLVVRSDPDQVNVSTISKADIDGMISAAKEGAKGAVTYTTLTTATTKADALTELNKAMADLQTIKAVGTATGNTSANVSTAVDTAITNLQAQITAVNGLADGQTLNDVAGSGAAVIAITAATKTVVDAGRTELATQTLTVDGTAIALDANSSSQSIVDTINALNGDYKAALDGGAIRIGKADGTASVAADITTKKGATPVAANVTPATGDTLKANTSFNDKLGFDNGTKITITSDMTAEDLRKALVAIEGVTADFNEKGNLIVSGEQGDDFIITDKSGKAAQLIGISGSGTNGNNARATYSKQFDGVMEQIDQLVNDTSYKGINLLKGDDLTVVFNESRTSTLEIKGVTLDSKGIGLTKADNAWKTNADIEKALTQIEKATSVLRAQASEFGQNLATVTTREDFTSNMINNLVSGSDKLTLADMNEEAANMLALQTRQQLATNSLSIASQAAQSVLKLF